MIPLSKYLKVIKKPSRLKRENFLLANKTNKKDNKEIKMHKIKIKTKIKIKKKNKSSKINLRMIKLEMKN